MGNNKNNFHSFCSGKIKNGQINSLTSLRFFAIMLVAIHHLNELIGWAPRVGWGNVGVTFFFVLSGFVLTLNYQKFSTYHDAARFLWRRFARLYPLHVVTFLTSIIVLNFYPIKLDSGPLSAFANLFLLQSWFGSREIHFAFNSLSWAISTLAFFYIAFAFIQYNFLRNTLIVILISLISLTLSVAYIVSNNSEPIEIHWLLKMFPTNRILVFILGMLTAKLFLWFRSWFSHIKTYVIGVVEIFSVLLIIDRLSSCIVLNLFLRKINRVLSMPEQLICQIFDTYMLTPVLFSFMILVFSMQCGLISRMISIRQFVFLGEISFAVYLTHQLVFRFFSGIGLKIIFSNTFLIPLAFLVTLVVSYFLYQFIEQPCSRHLKQAFSTKKNFR